MKTILKTYHCNLTGNKEKLSFLDEQHHYVQVIARYYLRWIRANKEYRKSEIHKSTYKKIRNKYPNLNSKLIQHTRDKVLSSVKDKKLFKVRKLTIPLIFDSQNFGVEFRSGYYNAWVRFCRNNYPLEGKRTIEKIKDNPIKEIQIKKIGTNWKIYFVCEVPIQDRTGGDKILGCDVNVKNMVLSDNSFYTLKRFVHKKLEYRKKKQRDKIVRFSRDYIHKLTSRMVEYLIKTGGSKVILENLTNIRKSSSRKNGTSKGRNLNYLLNNVFPFRMFQTFLEYKCLENGVEVEYIDPRNTSKTCSRCYSLDTERRTQPDFHCNSCGLDLNADLNGARNISRGRSFANGLLSHSNQSQLPKHRGGKPIAFSYR